MINEPLQAHDILTEFDPKRTRIFQKSAEIYRNGSSMREVSQKFGLSKSSVVDGLKRLGIKRKRRLPRASYGYICVSGKLVEHPLEQERIQIMRAMAAKGMKAWKISEELDRLKVPPRNGKKWCHKTIGKLLK